MRAEFVVVELAEDALARTVGDFALGAGKFPICGFTDETDPPPPKLLLLRPLPPVPWPAVRSLEGPSTPERPQGGRCGWTFSCDGSVAAALAGVGFILSK